MRILHIIVGLNQGGAEGALVRLIQSSDSPSGHVVVSLMDEGIHGATIRSFGAKVFALNQRKGCFSISAFQLLRTILREQRPDVVQTWMYHADLIGGVAAKSLGIPVVWGVRHSELSVSDLGYRTWLIAKACAMLSYLIPRAIVGCSRKSIRLHRRFGYADRFVYIPNGFHVAARLKNAMRASPDGLPVIGHAGRFHPVKNHSGFLQAVAKHVQSGRDCRVLMAGSGVLVSNLDFSALIPECLRSRVSALGPQDDMPAFYAHLDCFVLSSASEAFPNVVAEAMLAGVPCVVTDVGDAAEIVGDTGWVVAPGNVDALAEAITSAVEATKDSVSWADRKTRARERIVAEYSMDMMKSRFEAVWKTAMEN